MFTHINHTYTTDTWATIRPKLNETADLHLETRFVLQTKVDDVIHKL